MTYSSGLKVLSSLHAEVLGFRFSNRANHACTQSVDLASWAP